mmetsp:Transcript_27356/g.57545  ORF Transcript_27356/g.57545 Transcript_27356/m.57545 type:complete len:418 (-) Transcript_27356:302-1555(-)
MRRQDNTATQKQTKERRYERPRIMLMRHLPAELARSHQRETNNNWSLARSLQRLGMIRGISMRTRTARIRLQCSTSIVASSGLNWPGACAESLRTGAHIGNAERGAAHSLRRWCQRSACWSLHAGAEVGRGHRRQRALMRHDGITHSIAQTLLKGAERLMVAERIAAKPGARDAIATVGGFVDGDPEDGVVQPRAHDRGLADAVLDATDFVLGVHVDQGVRDAIRQILRLQNELVPPQALDRWRHASRRSRRLQQRQPFVRHVDGGLRELQRCQRILYPALTLVVLCDLAELVRREGDHLGHVERIVLQIRHEQLDLPLVGYRRDAQHVPERLRCQTSAIIQKPNFARILLAQCGGHHLDGCRICVWPLRDPRILPDRLRICETAHLLPRLGHIDYWIFGKQGIRNNKRDRVRVDGC